MEKIFTSLKWLVHEFLVLKSNFDLVGGKFVGCCIVACRANVHILRKISFRQA